MTAFAIRDFDDPGFNPFIISTVVAGQGEVANTYPELRRLRHISPLHELDPRVHFGTQTDGTLADRRKFLALGHPLVSRMLIEFDAFSNHNYIWNMGLMFGKSITTMDPPEHKGYRMLFQSAFGPRMIGQWKGDLVPRIVNRLIDKFVGRGHAELISEFALHFPFEFVMELLELPVEQRPVFHKLAFCQTAVRYDREHALEAGEKLIEYIQWMVNSRRDHPLGENDFVHVLATAEVNGERLPPIVIESFFRQLMNAAGDTSYHGFSSLLGALFLHPEQLAAVKADRSLIPQAIEEALRWEAPLVFVERSVHQKMEIAGHHLTPEDHITVAIGDANRDESVHDDPDSFNIFRRKSQNLSFGAGPHICIGRHIARVEMEIALNALLDRLPNVRIDSDQEPPRNFGVSMRKPKAVHVLFDA